MRAFTAAGLLLLSPGVILVAGILALLAAPVIAYLIVWLTRREGYELPKPTPPQRSPTHRTIPGGSGPAGS